MTLSGHLIWPPHITNRETRAQRTNRFAHWQLLVAELRLEPSSLPWLWAHYTFIQQVFLDHSLCGRHQVQTHESNKVSLGTYELQRAQNLWKRQTGKQLQYSGAKEVKGSTGHGNSGKHWLYSQSQDRLRRMHAQKRKNRKSRKGEELEPNRRTCTCKGPEAWNSMVLQRKCKQCCMVFQGRGK